MANLTGFVKQLKKERDRVEQQLSGLNAALAAFASAYSGSTPSRKRRKLSAKSRAKIAAAQRARWAKVSKAKVASKRTMSASSRRKIAAAQRARWAKFRAKKS